MSLYSFRTFVQYRIAQTIITKAKHIDIIESLRVSLKTLVVCHDFSQIFLLFENKDFNDAIKSNHFFVSCEADIDVLTCSTMIYYI
jgi:hypothetical protein